MGSLPVGVHRADSDLDIAFAVADAEGLATFEQAVVAALEAQGTPLDLTEAETLALRHGVRTVGALPLLGPQPQLVFGGVDHRLVIEQSASKIELEWSCGLPHAWASLQPLLDQLDALADRVEAEGL